MLQLLCRPESKGFAFRDNQPPIPQVRVRPSPGLPDEGALSLGENVNKPYREWSEKSKVKARARRRRYINKNREKVRETNARWRDANREYFNSLNRKYYWKNHEKMLERRRQWSLDNPDKIRIQSRRAILKLHHLTQAEYDEMFRKQNGLCAICGEPKHNKLGRLLVDHNHKTGMIRSLLCNGCNSLIGYSYESITILEKAIRYLRDFETVLCQEKEL